MSRTLADVNLELQTKHNTLNNTHDIFPVGTKVKVICACQDFCFFWPEKENLVGTVIRNSMRYIGIIVQWDEPRCYEDGRVQKEFNFAPDDLVVLTPSETYIPTKLEHAMQKANQMGICPEGEWNGKTEKRKGAFYQDYKNHRT